jgi:hypothetical protein
VQRNIGRFPKDFMFQLNRAEAEALRFQIGTSRHAAGVVICLMHLPNGAWRCYRAC